MVLFFRTTLALSHFITNFYIFLPVFYYIRSMLTNCLFLWNFCFSLVHLWFISLTIPLVVDGGWWFCTFCNFVQFLLFAENRTVVNKWQLRWLPRHTVVRLHWFHYWLFRGMWWVIFFFQLLLKCNLVKWYMQLRRSLIFENRNNKYIVVNFLEFFSSKQFHNKKIPKFMYKLIWW